MDFDDSTSRLTLSFCSDWENISTIETVFHWLFKRLEFRPKQTPLRVVFLTLVSDISDILLLEHLRSSRLHSA